MENKFLSVVETILAQLKSTQGEAVEAAAKVVADSVLRGGILQSFGCGHSQGSALEVANRAGGLIPSKLLRDPAYGEYEHIEGVGTFFMTKADIQPQDVVVIISNSGRNPMPIEVALTAKERGASVIAVTSLESSKKLTSRHSSGKRLFEIADVVLDNLVPDGDVTLMLDGMDTGVCGISSISAGILLQWMMSRSYEIMLKKGYVPPVYKSQNVDGGREYNNSLTKRYFERIYHI